MTINKLSGVAWGDISKVGGAAKADISKIGGEAAAAALAAATVWVGADSWKDNHLIYTTATPASFTSWTEYTDPTNSSDYTNISFGQDGAGGDMWVGTRNQAGAEIYYSTDPTQGAGSWHSGGNHSPGKTYAADWGNGKWVVACQMSVTKVVLTSSNGSTWGEVDISGLADITTTTINGIATDGEDNWVFGQNDRIYSSDDNGATWGLAYDFDDGRTVLDVAHTKNDAGVSVFGIAYKDSSNDGWAAAALVSDLTSWTSADGQVGDIGGTLDNIGGGGGTFIAVNSDDQLRSTDAGTTWVRNLNALARGSAESVEADGTGNWVCGHQNGYITYSTDDGVTWSDSLDTGSERWNGMACNTTTKDKE